VIRRVLALLLVGLSAGSVQPATDPVVALPPDTDRVSQVWDREADYWRFVEQGDVEKRTVTATAPGSLRNDRSRDARTIPWSACG
jgi:hypothetical protein